MVLKKKKVIQVDAFVLDQQLLERLHSFADAEGQNLASHLLQCMQLTDGIQQIHCIKQIVPLLEKMETNNLCDSMVKNCLDILTVMFLSLDIKNPLKKVLASSLNGLPEPLMAEATDSLASYLREELKSTDVSHYRNIMDNLAYCMEDTRIGTSSVHILFKEALQFLQKSVREIEEENRKLNGNRITQTRLMYDLLIGVKVSMSLIQKIQENMQENIWKKVDSPVWQSMCGLLNTFTCFLINEDLIQTVHMTAGLAVVLFLKTMFEAVEKLPCLISDLLLGSRTSDMPEWFMDNCENLCTTELSDSVLLFLCHGALAMLEWKNSSMGPSGEKLLLDIALILLTLSKRLKESSMAASLSRILTIWTSSALDALQSSSENLKLSLSGNSDTVEKMLDYVYAHWEHPLDAVRHQTKLIFKNLLQIHHAAVKGSVVKLDPFFSMLAKDLLSLEWHVKGKYSSLGCLVDCVGIENILEVDRTIPSQILDVMNDQSFAPYASDLLETMFTNHKKHLTSVLEGNDWVDDWHETWVSPPLLILCDGNPEQATYVTDYYLPKLLKCSPESLNYMIKILQTSAESNVGTCNTRGALGALMACLRTARAHGHLQFTNMMHGSLVSFGCIKQGLVHQHDQVQIDALGLLCESHRSTEITSTEEMELILFFLRYNLSNQSPAVRQQICSLLKKLFCRIYESSQTVHKIQQMKSKQGPVNQFTTWDPLTTLQKYKDFMSAVCGILFEALFPGSSHPTRFTVLTLLGIITEIFPVSEGQNEELFQIAQEVDPTRVQTLLHCFASTFEEVKILAFELLMKLHTTLPYFQDVEKLHPLFQVAVQLSSSTQPYDCVTASYLLKFLIHQKDLLKVCLKKPLPLNTFQPDEDGLTDSVEENTLAVIGYLLEYVEGEVLQAEKSLLQAASSFPMYGRVHCITEVLNQLPLNNLTLLSEWKLMVTRLIRMSYKLSAVVSPVVQSSSPEGLIPMDTDSDTSERLQLILNEIQPCDTNDYFTEAKLLKECCRQDCANERTESIATEDRGEEQQTCDVTAQMVLVCCWRSMKEVSLLLGKLCQLLPLQMFPIGSVALITVEQVEDIGEYFKHHLLKSRHRGAFELAYAGFVKLTDLLSRCNNERLQKLPQQWLYNVLEEIKANDPSSKLCATRRSAGIPFYIQALLASEPKKGKTGLLKMTMKELITLASPSDAPSSTIPQVHALNILRALFKDTRLGENIIPYVADGMRAAILGFTSSVWAVRNSSTLLFSTLITRIFGVKRGKDENSKKNRMTGREFFTRFPNLYPFLLSQLEVVASTVNSETGELKLHPNSFLLLLILGKLYPSPMDGTYSALTMAPFVPFILRCGNSPVYRTREMSGRALVPFVMINQVPQTISSLLAGLPDCTDTFVRQNAVHGTLLQVFHLLQSYLESKHRANSDFLQGLSGIVTCIEAKLWLAKRQNLCLVTRAAYLDVLVLLSNYLGKSRIKGTEWLGFWEQIGTIISDSELATGIRYSPAIPGFAHYLQSITKLFISMFSITADHEFENCPLSANEKIVSPSLSVAHLLHSDFHDVRLLVLEATLLWLKQVNSKHVTEGGRRGLLSLLPDLEEILLKRAIMEKHQECFCKVLEVLHCMDIRKLLSKTQDAIKINERDFLRWILNIVDISDSIEIQSVSLKFASKLVVHLTQNWQEVTSEVKKWIEIVTCSCGSEQQTDLRLAIAEILVSITPFFLTSQKLLLGLSDTLLLWKCVVQLLQSEEQIVRDAAAGVIRIAQSQENIFRKTELDFHVVNESMALDLTFSILCEMLQQWEQTSAGVVVLLEWLLGKDNVKDLETTPSVENDNLFDKGQTNFWAEKLMKVRWLSRHLLLLLPVTCVSPCDQEKLHQLAKVASDQAQLVTQLLKDMPPTPEFSRTVEFTKLAIQSERISIVRQILGLLNIGIEACREQEKVGNKTTDNLYTTDRGLTLGTKD